MGNNSRVEVKGIDTCKLTLLGGCTLLLHDVLYAPEIRRNLVCIIVLLKLGYYLNFHGDCMGFLNSVFVGTGFLLDGFMALDTELDVSSYSDGCFSLIASSRNDVDVNI